MSNSGTKDSVYGRKACILTSEEHKKSDCKYLGDPKKTEWICEKAGSSYTVKYGEQSFFVK